MGATVVVKGTSVSAIADKSGQFSIAPPKELLLTLRVSLVSYKPREVVVNTVPEYRWLCFI